MGANCPDNQWLYVKNKKKFSSYLIVTISLFLYACSPSVPSYKQIANAPITKNKISHTKIVSVKEPKEIIEWQKSNRTGDTEICQVRERQT